MSKTAKRRICVTVFALCLANFVVFFIGAVYLGGDAVNGKIVADHYYLMSHGRYTEVSADIFSYSKWHAYSTWITHPLAFIAGYWYYRLK